MFGHFSYFASILIFAGSAVLIEIVFDYHIVKQYRKLIWLMVIICVVASSLWEAVALAAHNWVYSASTTLHYKLLGAEIETYIFTAFVTAAISIAAIVWTKYEDEGSPILRQSLKDIFEGNFAIWRKKPKR